MKAIGWFLRKQVRPRLSEIVGSADAGLTVAVGLAFFVLSGPGGPFDANRLSVLDVAPNMLAYAAIGGGFALSGLTVAATFPPVAFLRFMAARSKEIGKSPEEPAHSLWFVFAWAATAHLLLVLIALAMLAARGFSPLAASEAWPSWRSAVGAVAASATFYCVLRFLVTIVTVIQVADVYLGQVLDDEEGEGPPEDPASTGPPEADG